MPPDFWALAGATAIRTKAPTSARTRTLPRICLPSPFAKPAFTGLGLIVEAAWPRRCTGAKPTLNAAYGLFAVALKHLFDFGHLDLDRDARAFLLQIHRDAAVAAIPAAIERRCQFRERQ